MRRDLLLIGLCAAAFAAITAGLAAGGPLVELDLAVHDWSASHRPGAAESIGRLLNRVGQGGALLAICAVLALWLAVERWWRTEGWWRAAAPPLYVAAATLLVVPSVLAIKDATERGAPSSDLPPEQTVELLGPQPAGEYAVGYPGGHAVNTIVWYGVLLVLVTGLLQAYGRPAPPRWLRLGIRLAPPVIVLVTTTYMSFHWLTDGLAGLALGLLIDRLLRLLQRWFTTAPIAPIKD